jgi:hypothetical protein
MELTVGGTPSSREAGDVELGMGVVRQHSLSDPPRPSPGVSNQRRRMFKPHVVNTFDVEKGAYTSEVHVDLPDHQGSDAAAVDGSGGDGGCDEVRGIGAGRGEESKAGGGGRSPSTRPSTRSPPSRAKPDAGAAGSSAYENGSFAQHEAQRRRHTFRPIMVWAVLLLMGVTASLVAWCLDECIDLLHRIHVAIALWPDAWWLRYVLWVSYSALLVSMATLLTWGVSPTAVGSGIPEMKSILSGYRNPQLLTTKTFIAKALGLVLAIGGGLPIGKEGPFVTTSACMGQMMMNVPWFKPIRDNPHLAHHILAASVAVGVSATFGSPIGGVLFSIEVTSTYYNVPTYWKRYAVSGLLLWW